MPVGTIGDFRINNDLFQFGATEMLRQNSDAFNERSADAIILRTQARLGDFYEEAFYKELGNVIQHRDNTVMTAVPDIPILQDTEGSVKLNRRIGPIAQTLDSYKKIGRDPDEMSLTIGEQVGKAQAVHYVNASLMAAAAALRANPALVHTETGGLNHKTLIRGMALRGDQGQEVAAWVVHSVAFYQWMENATDLALDSVAGIIINQASVPFLNRPAIVTDSPSLRIPDGAGAGIDQYISLGLTANAIVIEESEGRDIVTEPILGQENLGIRYQGEHAFNLSVKGYNWSQAAGANPANAALSASANWAQTKTSIKDLGGVVMITQ